MTAGKDGGRHTGGMPVGWSADAGGDEGSGTMAGVALIVLVAVLLSSVATAGRLLVLRSSARGVADLSALAAAVALDRGDASPCAVASASAVANAARLVSCELVGEGDGDVTVRVGVATRVPFMPEITVDSRAGPVPCRPGGVPDAGSDAVHLPSDAGNHTDMAGLGMAGRRPLRLSCGI